MRLASFQLSCGLHMQVTVSLLRNCTLSLKAPVVAGVESYHFIRCPSSLRIDESIVYNCQECDSEGEHLLPQPKQ